MTPEQIFFLLTAFIILAASILVVTARRMIHAALWLVAALAGVAVLFVLLQAPFFAVVQVIVYIGAIAVLFIFAVMLTRRAMTDPGPQLNRYSLLAAAVSLAFFALLAGVILTWPGSALLAMPLDPGADQVANLGLALTDPAGYLLPFEVASVLLLAALVGAIYIGRDRELEEVQR